jgi:hypothetical protein
MLMLIIWVQVNIIIISTEDFRHVVLYYSDGIPCRRFSQSEKHMSIDVDIGSSMVATGVVQLAIGYVTTLTVDIAFLLEGQTLDELPERLLGSIRLHNLELKAAVAIPTLDLSRGGVSTGEGVVFFYILNP